MRIVLRSGCYLTHDSGIYARLVEDVQYRTSSDALAFAPALEVWAHVLSTPEAGLVILSAGRRDFGQDSGNPVPTKHVPRGSGQPRAVTGQDWRVVGVSDQHAHVRVPAGHGIGVGDLVALSPSHPCTTFDKWRVIHIVDDAYNVTESVRTWF
jgi:D-serine dehydratase